jgi:PAS domain S-box-containing protein
VITILDVTALKQAEKRIQDLSDLHTDVLADVGDFIVRWKASDGIVTYCNAAYAELEGKKPDDLIGARIEQIIPDSQQAEFFGPIRDLRPGEYASGQMKREAPDGSIYWRAAQTRAIPDRNENVEFYQSTGRDATSEVEYLHALEALLKAVDQEGPDDASSVSALLKVAAGYLKLDHVILARQKAKSVSIEAHGGIASDAVKVGAELPPSALFVRAEFDASGMLILSDVAASSNAASQAEREFEVAAFIGARLHDYTKLKSMVCGFSIDKPRERPFSSTEIGFVQLLAHWIDNLLERGQQVEAIKQSESELQLIFDAVPSRIVYKDLGNNLLRVNKTAAKYFGLDPDNLKGANLSELYDDAVAARILGEDEAVIESGTIERSIVRGLGLDGKEVGWIQRIRVPHNDAVTGEPRVLVVSTDITEEKETEERLRRLNVEFKRNNSELENVNEGLASFAFVASHDLQEPLRKITQFGDLLLQEYDSKLDEDGKYYVNVMSNSAYRMSRLIRGLLDYSTASNHEIELEEVSLPELFADIVADQEVMIDDANGAIEIGELPLIHADRSMTSSLFGNIVSNGLKYRHAERAPVVKIAASEVDGAYEITISDNGVGFDNRQRDKIFEPFARLHKRSDFEGSGIGLAICRSVCDRHGWSMRATSEIGAGSAFTVRIPIPAGSGDES